ncbi:MAG: IS4 family transposase [Peptostreptococcaceae bacterium]
MIYPNSSAEKSLTTFFQTFKVLGIAKLLRQAGINKHSGIPTYEAFQSLILLVFQGKTLYQFLHSKRKDQIASKNTYYRFLNDSTFNWRRFLLALVAKITVAFSKLTDNKRVKVFILDDSVVTRNRSKSVELMARVYDHVTHKYQKGFTMLTLGWSDGYSFLPVDFTMLSSPNESNRLVNASATIDKRTNGYKRRKEAIEKKPEVAIMLIQNALKAGIFADYVLMDTWFTTEPMIKGVLGEGLHVIGMVKQLKQKYSYKGHSCDLKELRTLLPKNTRGDILGEVIVYTKERIPVKLVFVKNRNNKREWLVILSTDLSLSSQEIVRIYGNRWSIEVFFKSVKSFMKLGTEFQGRSYDMMISHTTIVYCRYILLEWLKREDKDMKTWGELFLMYCDDIQDMDVTTALESLMGLFVEHVNTGTRTPKETLKSQLIQWIDSQATFIKALFKDLQWES